MSIAGRPIKPEEVVAEKARSSIPPEVFDAFNQAITIHWHEGQATFTQREVIDAITLKMRSAQPSISCEHPDKIVGRIFANHWLNVEDVYREAGWSVEYDKPGYNETYAATFTFKKGRKRRG